jgi:hypothetical protein
MNEVCVVSAFFLPMGLLVARMMREHREQAAGEGRRSLREAGRQDLFSFLTARGNAVWFAKSKDRRFHSAR